MWKYKQYEFDTKIERDCFVKGYIAAKIESIENVKTDQTQDNMKPIDYPCECGIEARLIFDEI